MFSPGFTSPNLLEDSNDIATGLSPSLADHSRPFTQSLVRFRSPLLTESLLLSFPPGTEMFQFPGFALLPYALRQE